MSRPHVVTHTLISADGRLEGFPLEVALYYEVASEVLHDAVLAGSGTMVAAATDAGVDLTQEDQPRAGERHAAADADKPLLVVVDSGGRLTRFDWLRGSGLWSAVMALGSRRTPDLHRARLRDIGVDLETFGDDRVDLAAALQHLREDRAVETVRVDAGPGLNGALLDAGLLDEVSILVAPYLVGEGRTFLDGLSRRSAQRLELTSVEPRAGAHLWLRYTVNDG